MYFDNKNIGKDAKKGENIWGDVPSLAQTRIQNDPAVKSAENKAISGVNIDCASRNTEIIPEPAISIDTNLYVSQVSPNIYAKGATT